jgi:hypothetical protein
MSVDRVVTQVVERRVSASLFHLTGLADENEVVLHQRADGWFFMHIRRGDSSGWWGPFESKQSAVCRIMAVCRPAPAPPSNGDEKALVVGMSAPVDTAVNAGPQSGRFAD